MEDIQKQYLKIFILLGFSDVDAKPYFEEIVNLGLSYAFIELVKGLKPEQREQIGPKLLKCNSLEEAQEVVKDIKVSTDELKEFVFNGQKKALVNFLNKFLENLPVANKEIIKNRIIREYPHLLGNTQ